MRDLFAAPIQGSTAVHGCAELLCVTTTSTQQRPGAPNTWPRSSPIPGPAQLSSNTDIEALLSLKHQKHLSLNWHGFRRQKLIKKLKVWKHSFPPHTQNTLHFENLHEKNLRIHKENCSEHTLVKKKRLEGRRAFCLRCLMSPAPALWELGGTTALQMNTISVSQVKMGTPPPTANFSPSPLLKMCGVILDFKLLMKIKNEVLHKKKSCKDTSHTIQLGNLESCWCLDWLCQPS